eukprot:5262543-Prymnesium_polylepis.1
MPAYELRLGARLDTQTFAPGKQGFKCWLMRRQEGPCLAVGAPLTHEEEQRALQLAAQRGVQRDSEREARRAR